MIDYKYYKKINKKIKKLICKFEVISFDVFDTLLVRPFARPGDLFLYIENKYNVKGFYNIRVSAEQLARKKSKCEEVTLDEIYSYIDEKYLFLKNIEMKSEFDLLRSNPLMDEIFDYCKLKQKKIILISDMYLDKKFINQCLNKNGYYGFELFLSSSIKFCKYSGNLFKFICKNISADNILHIGDNYYSDYIVPKSIGIKSVFVPSPISMTLNSNPEYFRFYNKYKNDLTASILLGMSSIFQISKDRNYFYDFGKAIGGPILTAFTKWIFDKAKENKYDLVLFSSRDGYILEKLFQLMSNNKIKSKYVYANRCLRTAINIELREDVDYQMQGIIDIIINSCINNLDFKNIDVPSLKFPIEKKIDFIINNKKLILQTQNSICSKYNLYIKDICRSTKNICIVDGTTTQFSAQKLIQNIINKKINGCYFLSVFKILNINIPLVQ